MTYPAVLTEQETLSMLELGASIARYGDGELKLCRGGSAKAQAYEKGLSDRLKWILRSPSACLVGIPRIADPEAVPEDKRVFWAKYAAPEYANLYEPGKIYGSAFITRPDSAPHIDTEEYFERMKALWSGRRVVLVNGDNKRFNKDGSILETASAWERWEMPAQNAWAVYPELLKRCKGEGRETLFILALGPTATVLAFDLDEAGYQALDLGHLGMFYARFRRGVPLSEFDKTKE